MRKKVVILVIAVALLVCVLGTLVACESYKASALSKVGDKNAKTESNGGLVVKQGDYLYFVNGYTGYLTDKGKQNWFGNVVKGAIVRVSYKDGVIGDDYTVVVPKSVMASSDSFGFSIYGNWIYYVSPCADEDRSGAVQTSTLQFMRTKLDGTGTQLILNWDNNSVQYNYTSTALVYFDSSESKLYSKDLSAKKFKKKDKGKCIAEDVASVYFGKNESYTPGQTEASIEEYVFYTKNSEEDYEYGNTLYVTDPLGKKTKTVIGSDTYTDGKYSIKLLTSSVKDGALSIYYTKTSYVGTSSTGSVVGTFAYRFVDKEFAFATTKEVKLSSKELSSLYVIGYDEGVVTKSSDAVIYYTDGKDPKSYAGLDLSNLVAVYNDTFYYLSDSVLRYYPMDGESNAHYAYTTGETFKTDFIAAELLDGSIYFIQDDDYKYMARIKLSDIDIYADKEAEVVRIAKITAEDQAKIDAAAAEKEDSDEK